MVLTIEGSDLAGLTREAGGHRFQRIPPTEKRGRVHTSTVTVAVMDTGFRVAGPWDNRRDQDFRIEWFSGTGKGGQHRNKHQNSCRVIHIPTGTMEARQGRERVSNLTSAKKALLEKLDQMGNIATAGRVGEDRKAMVGTGQRGDKVRTIRLQANQAVDHRTEKRMAALDYMNGRMDALW